MNYEESTCNDNPDDFKIWLTPYLEKNKTKIILEQATSVIRKNKINLFTFLVRDYIDIIIKDKTIGNNCTINNKIEFVKILIDHSYTFDIYSIKKLFKKGEIELVDRIFDKNLIDFSNPIRTENPFTLSETVELLLFFIKMDYTTPIIKLWNNNLICSSDLEHVIYRGIEGSDFKQTIEILNNVCSLKKPFKISRYYIPSFLTRNELDPKLYDTILSHIEQKDLNTICERLFDICPYSQLLEILDSFILKGIELDYYKLILLSYKNCNYNTINWIDQHDSTGLYSINLLYDLLELEKNRNNEFHKNSREKIICFIVDKIGYLNESYIYDTICLPYGTDFFKHIVKGSKITTFGRDILLLLFMNEKLDEFMFMIEEGYVKEYHHPSIHALIDSRTGMLEHIFRLNQKEKEWWERYLSFTNQKHKFGRSKSQEYRSRIIMISFQELDKHLPRDVITNIFNEYI